MSTRVPVSLFLIALAACARHRAPDAPPPAPPATTASMDEGIAGGVEGGVPGGVVGGVVGGLPLFAPVLKQEAAFNTEGYAHVADSGFRRVETTPLSTFSIDVDTAS